MSLFSSLTGSSSKLKSLLQAPNDNSSSSSSTNSSRSHVVVDLASQEAESALNALLSLPILACKVKSATVHAESLRASRCGRIMFDRKHVERIFEALALLPCLTSLTVELNFHVISLPLSALLKVFQTQSSLKRLQLKHLHLMGSQQEVEQMQALAPAQAQLQVLILHACSGVAPVTALLDHLPSLIDVHITNTALAPVGCPEQLHSVLLQLLNRAPLHTPLKSLHLQDIPELEDEHCVVLARALHTNTSLQALYLSSTLFTDESAQACADMLLLNGSLQKVALHFDSEWLADYLAPVLRANRTNIQRLDIRIYNDHTLQAPTHGCLQIAKALKRNSNLLALRLRLEIEIETLSTQVVQAFEQAIEIPTVALQSLSLDDGMQRYPLSPQAKFQLQLNQCGVRKMLQQHQTASLQEQVDALIQTTQLRAPKTNQQATTQQGDSNLNATFYLLQNSPQLILAALQNYENGSIVPNNNDTSANAQQQSSTRRKRGHRSRRPHSTKTNSPSKDPIMSAWKKQFQIQMPSFSRRTKTNLPLLPPSA